MGKSFFRMAVFFTFCVLALVFAMQFPKRHAAVKTRATACAANIKMLENALEMYEMDNPINQKKSSETTVVCPGGGPVSIGRYGKALSSGGYVQRLPLCPTTYRFETYEINRNPERDWNLFVRCKEHGIYEEAKENGRKARKEWRQNQDGKFLLIIVTTVIACIFWFFIGKNSGLNAIEILITIVFSALIVMIISFGIYEILP
ncbi:hypothetical protein KAJ27_00585 [bacterium]|nr:hypothetical protein [bacterium]